LFQIFFCNADMQTPSIPFPVPLDTFHILFFHRSEVKERSPSCEPVGRSAIDPGHLRCVKLPKLSEFPANADAKRIRPRLAEQDQ
jgi:hypothetical protein